MRWHPLAAGILAVFALTGCPSEFGTDGRIAKAVHKDAQEQLGIRTCSEAYKHEVCDGPHKNPAKCSECP